MRPAVDRSPVSLPSRVVGERVVLVAAFAVAWWFWDTPLLFPLRMLVVAAHEASHALAAIATGGQVVEVGLDIREGGHALTRGGWTFGVLNAGYLGSLVWGLILLRLTRGAAAARGLSVTLALGLAGMAFAWVRPVLGFGFAYTLVAAVALGGLGFFAGHGVNRFALRAVGLFSVLYAFLDIRDDVFLSSGMSDAGLLAVATGIPAVVWGLGWCVAGATAVWAVLWRRPG